MKNNIPAAAWFVIGALTLALIAQKSVPSSSMSPRFFVVTTNSGPCVIDSFTGATKVLGGDPRTIATARMEYAQPFYP